MAPHSDVVVVVDVLSFSTAVDIAVGRGATVYPYRWRNEGAAAFAEQVGAVLAGGRSSAQPDVPYSLSPASLQTIPTGSLLVLPSPNGATLSLLAEELGATVLTGCLRNASTVATACENLGTSVAVIAAGERRVAENEATGSFRFAVEDLVGAGAILSAFDVADPSPEAMAAISAFFAATRYGEVRFLETCASGKELIELRFAEDVGLAAEIDVSQTVPRLVAGAFRHWSVPS